MSAPFVVRERVRWSDVDAAGIVCHGMYLRFFELAESELLRTVGLPARVLSGTHGLWRVRRRIECDFLQPARSMTNSRSRSMLPPLAAPPW